MEELLNKRGLIVKKDEVLNFDNLFLDPYEELKW
jgi:hypothetical protein